MQILLVNTQLKTAGIICIGDTLNFATDMDCAYLKCLLFCPHRLPRVLIEVKSLH